MKTLTEFAVLTLKNAHTKQQELSASGKTAEELPAALGEALKLEGDKLTFLLAALDTVGEKTKDLKRVIVSQLNEGESAPSGAKLVGEKYYTVEYYSNMSTAPKQEERDPRGGGRDGKRGGKPGERGGKPGGDRGGRGGGEGRRPEGGAGGPGGAGAAGGRGAPRGPRPAQAAGGGTGRLPVPNKSGGGGLPTPNKTSAEPQSGGSDSAPSSDNA